MINKPDFKLIFTGQPFKQLIMSPDLTMVAATDEYYKATHTKAQDLIGKNVFDVFGESPDTTAAKGKANLSKSLMTVIKTKKPHTLPLQRYDFPLPENEGSGYAACWWRITNSPILDPNGKLVFIANTVEDVTHMVDVLEDAQKVANI